MNDPHPLPPMHLQKAVRQSDRSRAFGLAVDANRTSGAITPVQMPLVRILAYRPLQAGIGQGDKMINITSLTRFDTSNQDPEVVAWWGRTQDDCPVYVWHMGGGMLLVDVGDAGGDVWNAILTGTIVFKARPDVDEPLTFEQLKAYAADVVTWPEVEQ